MRRVLLSVFGLLCFLLAPTDPAEAQFGYPRGYGRYGWGGWGGMNINYANDPAAGYTESVTATGRNCNPPPSAARFA